MGCSPARRSPSAAGSIVPRTRTLADAEQRRAQVRQGRQISGCAHRTLRWDHRVDPCSSRASRASISPAGDAGVTACQRIDLESENQPHDGIRQRIAHARRVRQQQIPLQQFELLGGYAGLREQSETRIDAVGRIAGSRRSCPPRRSPTRCERDRAADKLQHRRLLVDSPQCRQRQAYRRASSGC